MQQNPELVRRIQQEFIPVALDTSDFFGINSPANSWFINAGKKVNLNLGPGGTKTWQGYYILGADGTGYGYAHNREMGAERVQNTPGELNPRTDLIYEIMDRALEQFRQRPSSAVIVTKEEKEAPFSYTPPPSASVLRVFSRLASDVKGHPYFDSIGRDHCWIYADEVKSVLDIADATQGRFPLPSNITYRIARFHLTDNARGIGRTWEFKEVRKADFQALEMKGAEGKRRFQFSGRFDLQGGGSGYQGFIEGQFDIDVAANKITRFRAFAEGDGWGKLCFNENAWPKDLPLVVGIVEANDEQARLIAPRTMTISPTSYGKHVLMQDEYQNPAGLKRSPVGPNLLKPVLDLASWRTGGGGGSVSKLSVEGDSLRFDITTLGQEEWNVQFSQGPTTLEEGTRYLLRFRMKANVARRAHVRANVEAGDYHSVGVDQDVNLTAEWQEFSFPFTATRTEPGKVGVPRFVLGQKVGTVWVSDISLTKAE